jgi:hypothetical protein
MALNGRESCRIIFIQLSLLKGDEKAEIKRRQDLFEVHWQHPLAFGLEIVMSAAVFCNKLK